MVARHALDLVLAAQDHADALVQLPRLHVQDALAPVGGAASGLLDQPALLDGELVIRGERLPPPADPLALVRGLGAFLVPGALGELLRLNLERHSRVGVAQADVLLAGVERVFDGVSEVLTARLLVGR